MPKLCSFGCNPVGLKENPDESHAIKLGVNLYNEPAAIDDDDHRGLENPLSSESDVRPDTETDTVPEKLAEESVVPHAKIFSWQQLSETVPVVEDEVEETEKLTGGLSMYCDDEKQPSQLLGDLDTGLEGISSHQVLRCNVCHDTLVGIRYTCVQCSDLFLCGACESNGAHHQHYVLRVPADRPQVEVKMVLATIRRYLMRRLDPLTEIDHDRDDAMSIKSEVKSEVEDDEKTNKESPDDDVSYTSVTQVSSHHGDLHDEAASLMDSDESSGDEWLESRVEKGRRSPTPDTTKTPINQENNEKENGLPWAHKKQVFVAAQPTTEAVVLLETMADSQTQTKVADQQSRRKIAILKLSNNKTNTRTTVIGTESQPQFTDEDENNAVGVKIKAQRLKVPETYSQIKTRKDLQTKVKDVRLQSQANDVGMQLYNVAGEAVDRPSLLKVVGALSPVKVSGSKSQIVRPESIASGVQSKLVVPTIQYASRGCSIKLLNLSPQAFISRQKPVTAGTDLHDSKIKLAVASTHKADKRMLIEEAESGDAPDDAPVKKRCLTSDLSNDATKAVSCRTSQIMRDCTVRLSRSLEASMDEEEREGEVEVLVPWEELWNSSDEDNR